MDFALDIAVVGAGPAGLSAALFLNRQGHRITIFDRFQSPLPLGSGLILQPTGLSVLAHLGLLDKLLALGHRIERLYGTESSSNRTVLDVRYEAGGEHRFGLAVQRAALFNLLYQAVQAAGIQVTRATEIVVVRSAGARARIGSPANPDLGAYDLVVDASGARSNLVDRLGLGTAPREFSYGAFWCNLQAAGYYERHALVQRYRRAQVMIGLLPVGRDVIGADDKIAFFWSQKIKDVESLKAAGMEQWKTRIRGYWPEIAPRLEEIKDWDQLSLARYRHRTLRHPYGNNIVMIGDAAHSTSPQLGQGANMALLDAAALAFSLSSAPSIEQALRGYADARRLHVRLFQSLSLIFTPFYQSDSRLFPILRDRLVATLVKIPPAPAILAAIVSGMVADPFGNTGIEEQDWLQFSRHC